MTTRILNKPRAVIKIYADANELAQAAAHHFAGLADRHIAESGRFTVALSGGSTPKQMFSILAEKPFAETVPWASIYLFWADERCVPPDHPDSNYRVANEMLLSKVSLPRENIFRILAEDEDHERAAKNYSETIRQFFHLDIATSGTIDLPGFDLIFLGMGPDGHTASLFPRTEALQINDRIVAANYVEKFQSYRITLTAATINHAHNVTFLVAGDDKAATLREVLEGQDNPDLYPSQLIKLVERPVDGSLLWMADEAAAKLLGQ